MSQHKPLSYSRNARTPEAYTALGLALAVWFALGIIQAHWVLLALAVIPPSLAAWDIMKNDAAHLELTDSHLNYGIGTDLDRVPLNRIEVIRLNRRLDFSWRVTMRLTDGTKLRIPPPCVPPMPAFEAALEARNVRIDRILFAFAG